jgi:hypothetical protein
MMSPSGCKAKRMRTNMAHTGRRGIRNMAQKCQLSVLLYEENRKFGVKCESDCYDRAREEWRDDYEAVTLIYRSEPDPGFD